MEDTCRLGQTKLFIESGTQNTSHAEKRKTPRSGGRVLSLKILSQDCHNTETTLTKTADVKGKYYTVMG